MDESIHTRGFSIEASKQIPVKWVRELVDLGS